MPLIDQVRRTLQRYQLATPDTRVIAAVSGGPDSMAMLHALHALHAAGELHLIAIVHLNHQLRDAASTDEQFCVDVAAALHLPIVAERVDVRGMAAREHRSIEDAAHRARYALFERARAQHNADVVAVGHTRDDQAETFLLRLVRGAGARGLGAMYPRNGSVIRPLIHSRRHECRAFLDEQGIRFVHDASNDDVGVPRNRVRAELLPLLAERFNPGIVEVLAAESDLARADHQYLDQVAAEWSGSQLRETDGELRLPATALAALPRSIAWRALHGAMTRAAGGRLILFDHVDRAWAVCAEGAAGFDAPGHRVQRVGADIVLTGSPAGVAGRRSSASDREPLEISRPLPVPGEVVLPELGWAMSAEVVSAGEVPEPDPGVAVVALDKVTGALAVRNRRKGDRLKPSPAGHRKLQDLLVDRKVPRQDRDRIPIVTDSTGRIVWVAGHAVDWDFKVSDPAQAVLVLRLKGVGGSF